MNKLLRDKWVKALRSREYRQGKKFLENQGRYCCLGVLCKVAGKQIPPSAGSLDHELWELRDECDLGAMHKSDSLQGRLADLNDLLGYSFPAIADWIEANVPVDEAVDDAPTALGEAG